LYLLSYILAFKWPQTAQRHVWLYVFCLNLIIALALFYFGRQFDVLSQLIFYLLILFSGCMLCHLELARTAPHRQQLTGFYFWLALGGAAGSLLMNLLVPLLFVRQYEFLLVILAIALLVLAPQLKQKPLYQLLTGLTVLLLSTVVWLAERSPGTADVFSGRNFYGSVQVRDIKINAALQRQLIDGTTSHGSQYLAPPLSLQAQSYYRERSGGALALQHFLPALPTRSSAQLQQRHVGLIGLGAGALAVYGKRGDSMTFYEINPLVITAASEYFTYLRDSAAQVNIVSGDGRLQLQKQLQAGSQQFDVLVLDAFSSDSVPQHLLTKEAMQLYWQHLMSDGVLAVHVSNNYLDLTTLLRNHAAWLNKDAHFFSLPAQHPQPATQWVLISANKRFAAQPVIQQAITPWPQRQNPTLMWTDDFSNLLQILK
ncbi:MAG TPA: fused MFS/spermidine synthase, partial [Rheinheimera sp.]|nr:fused MFS/spermidine synthase [Rheinheimera sp.]